jgi:hypothetical protein
MAPSPSALLLIVVVLTSTVGCRNAPEPASSGQLRSDQTGAVARDRGQVATVGASEEPPLQVADVPCPEPDLGAFRGVVEQHGRDYSLRVGDRSIPLWEIAQQEAMAPRSPDLSDVVGREAVICGDFDGSALYRARLVR